MAPARSKKKQLSSESDTSERQGQNVISSVAIGTPQRSPQKPIMRITATQKQALIDNLQLEGILP